MKTGAAFMAPGLIFSDHSPQVLIITDHKFSIGNKSVPL